MKILAMGEERETRKIDWMYEGKNSSVDHEQYLLGKRITTLANDEEEKGDFLVKTESSVATGNVTVLERLDYESKVREDPLFQIRKNDYEHRKELLSNPLKKKRIQNMLKEALVKDLRKSGLQESDSSAEENDSSSSSSSEDERSRRKSHKKKHKGRHSDYKKSSKHKKSHSSSDRDRKDKKKRPEKVKDRNESDESSDDDGRGRRNRDKPAGFGLICVQDGKHVSVPAKRRRKRTPSPEKPKERYQRVNRSGFSQGLSKEEKEKKLREMMDNASWRDSQRKVNVKRFKIEEEREDERERKQESDRKKDKYGQSRDFLHNMKLKTAASGSVEDSVKRKRHTLSHKF